MYIICLSVSQSFVCNNFFLLQNFFMTHFVYSSDYRNVSYVFCIPVTVIFRLGNVSRCSLHFFYKYFVITFVISSRLIGFASPPLPPVLTTQQFIIPTATHGYLFECQNMLIIDYILCLSHLFQNVEKRSMRGPENWRSYLPIFTK